MSEVEHGSQWFPNLKLHLNLAGGLVETDVLHVPCLMAPEICISNTMMPLLPVLGAHFENHWWRRPGHKRQLSINGCKSLTKLLSYGV